MDKNFWEEVASLWILVQSKEEHKLIEQTASCIFNNAIQDRHEEKTLLEELMSGIDEECDDDGY